MIEGSIDSIETFGLLDGPGIRTVVFLNGCKLRCKYCHNPEMWVKKSNNITSDELVKKVLRNKSYYRNNGGVTFSGGEPLLQTEFLIDCCKKLKQENIHVAIDTAGVGNGRIEELLKYVDLVLLDIKHTNKDGYYNLVNYDIEESNNFIDLLNKLDIDIWIRQVIIPDVTDTVEYLNSLKQFIKKINRYEKIEFLPYHNYGIDKYKKLGIDYPYKDKEEMDKDKCSMLYEKFINS